MAAASGGAGGTGGSGAGGFDFSQLGNMMGGQGGGSKGGGKNFLSEIADSEKNVWTNYINSTNLQHQSTLPTKVAPVPQATAPAQQPVVVQAPLPKAPEKPAAEQPIVEPSSPAVDPAFNGYVEASQQANEEKKKNTKTENATVL